MSRPVGSKNITDVAIQHPSRCKNCDSTGRTPYRNIETVEGETTLSNGVGITHYTKQQTCCTKCGVWRHDITYHNLPHGQQPVIADDTGFPPAMAKEIEKPTGRRKTISTTLTP